MKNFNQKEYISQYNKENYCQILLRIPAGQRDQLKAQAAEKGYPSVNSYILALLEKDK